MQHLTLPGALIAVVGLAFAVSGVRRLLQRRYLKAAGLEFSGLLLEFFPVSRLRRSTK
jgi:hypothetical protein